LLGGADVHLDDPAVVAVFEVELFEGGGADGAEGAEVGKALAPEEADQACAEPITEALVGADCALLGLAEDARADDEVGGVVADGLDELGGFACVLAAVSLKEDKDGVVGSLGKCGEAGGTVAFFCGLDDCGAGAAGFDRSIICGAVVGDDGVRENASRQTQQSLRDYVLLIVGGNDQPHRRTSSDAAATFGGIFYEGPCVERAHRGGDHSVSVSASEG